MLDAVLRPLRRHHALRRFWKSLRRFWQILVQYRLNLWNRDFFNAFEFRNDEEIRHQTQLLVLSAAVGIGPVVMAVWRRKTFQRSWRGWVSRHPISAWLRDERHRRIDLWNGEHQNAEYRIAGDARLATDAPIDLRIGLLAFALTDDEAPSLIDNFPRLAECLSSASRAGNFLTAFDRFEPAGQSGG